MEIQNIISLLNSNYEVDNLIRNSISLFINHITQYKEERQKLMIYNNKSLMIDFYKKSLNILKNTNSIVAKLDIEDKVVEKNIKEIIQKIINEFVTFNIHAVKCLN
jgi:hypothetical protein